MHLDVCFCYNRDTDGYSKRNERWMDRSIDEQMDGQIDKQIHRSISDIVSRYRQTDRWICRYINACMGAMSGRVQFWPPSQTLPAATFEEYDASDSPGCDECWRSICPRDGLMPSQSSQVFLVEYEARLRFFVNSHTGRRVMPLILWRPKHM